MTTFGRSVVAGITAVAVFYFTFWITGALLVAARLRPTAWPMWMLSFAAGLALAVIAARFVWRRSSVAGSAAASVLTGAVTVGAIGFCIGFFGPMLLNPGANQGPLLGIFIMGPAGFVLGAIRGWVRWAARRARESGPAR